jgi:hypothetical protein
MADVRRYREKDRMTEVLTPETYRVHWFYLTYKSFSWKQNIRFVAFYVVFYNVSSNHSKYSVIYKNIEQNILQPKPYWSTSCRLVKFYLAPQTWLALEQGCLARNKLSILILPGVHTSKLVRKKLVKKKLPVCTEL